MEKSLREIFATLHRNDKRIESHSSPCKPRRVIEFSMGHVTVPGPEFIAGVANANDLAIIDQRIRTSLASDIISSQAWSLEYTYYLPNAVSGQEWTAISYVENNKLIANKEAVTPLTAHFCYVNGMDNRYVSSRSTALQILVYDKEPLVVAIDDTPIVASAPKVGEMVQIDCVSIACVKRHQDNQGWTHELRHQYATWSSRSEAERNLLKPPMSYVWKMYKNIGNSTSDELYSEAMSRLSRILSETPEKLLSIENLFDA